MTKWRLIDTGFLNGYENMALDEALLINFKEGSSPVLRLYGWEPAAVSIGRFQKISDFLNAAECTARNIPIVRRITGGGMIYHHKELTYSIVATPEHLGVSKKPADAYRKICGFLLEFYRRLWMEADFAMDTKGWQFGGRENFCFAANEQYDIVINGKKIGGNAQRWLKNAVFQHGSIPVENCIEQASSLLISKPDNILESSTSLKEQGVDETYRYLFTLMKDSFLAKTYDDALTDAEKATMNELLETKYKPDSWKNYEDQ
ncbi:MAG: lipoate--protein ligase family protein [Denitrovibrio sp.]|nr:MAG: lipoate--protein ligase family protein [Denitrovibrio sp.]